MAKTSQEIEKAFIDSIQTLTGKSLNHWLSEIKASNIDKRNAIIAWLKQSHNFRHTDASLLVGIYLNKGKPVYASAENLLDNQLAKYESFKPLFEYISKQILEAFPNSKMIPKKTYVSFTEKREFAAINIKSKEIRLGMDLGDLAFNDTLEKAKLTGPMPRISHMVMIREEKDLSQNVMEWLNASYARIHS